MLTQTNGRLANRFEDQCAPYFLPFYYVNTVNDYSGAFKNPHWGTWGATVFWGGGHGGTNDNTVTVAEYGQTAITFKRVSDPTPWFGTSTDEGTRFSNSRDNANASLNFDYMESTVDGQPGSPHSYCSGDIVGPEFGGATHGTLLQVAAAAVNHRNTEAAFAAHEIRFDTLTLRTTSGANRKWRRVTNNTGGSWFGSSPFYSAFVGAQQRVYILTQGTGLPGPVRWFDRNSNRYVLGTGTGFSIEEMEGFDSGNIFWVPSRNLLVCVYPLLNARLKVQWMSVRAQDSQPTLGSSVTLSQNLQMTLPWSAATWCSHNNRIIVAGVAGDSGAVYEIEIPTTLNAATQWPVTRAPFGAGQTLPLADPGLDFGVTYKKFHYDEKIRAIVYMPQAARAEDGDDRVWVYRPRNT